MQNTNYSTILRNTVQNINVNSFLDNNDKKVFGEFSNYYLTIQKEDNFNSSKPKENKGNNLVFKGITGILALGVCAFGIKKLINGQKIQTKGQNSPNINTTQQNPNVDVQTPVIQNADENNIRFSPAKTIEEAIEHGMQTLKIKSYSGFEYEDEKCALDILNFINEALTRVKNATKGQVRMPEEIVYKNSPNSKEVAYMRISRSSNGDTKGILGLNKSVFGNLDEKIEDKIMDLEDLDVIGYEGKIENPIYDTKSSKILLEMIEKLRANTLSYKEKFELFNKLRSFHDRAAYFEKHTITMAEDFFKQNKIAFSKDNVDSIKALPKILQREKAKELLKPYIQDGSFKIEVPYSSPYRSIYHEMGHLQDDVERTSAKGCYKSEADYPKELRDWLDNQKNMELASSVSIYASSGPGEFIAEVYARIMSGNKVSDEVIDLYKKMNGPKIFN